MPPSTTRVLLIAPPCWPNQMLAAVLATVPQIQLAGWSTSTAQGAAATTNLQPHLVLVDAALGEYEDRMPTLSAGTTARVLVFKRAEKPPHEVDYTASVGAASVEAILSLTQLIYALQEIDAVRASLTPAAAELVVPNRVATEGAAPVPLTARECNVVRLVASGLSNKEIARTLGVSVATVKTHVHNVLVKLKLQRRAQLAFWASTSRWLFT
ncbi:response regulator transcription factor [Paraburkholderia sp. CNPSo 3076]|uniref:response regulator transcription factor n=1 Tax=Paraburkholderia sp. CNPSo 3076 TaxID=2940936 RepID=UPI00225B8C64|nr:response regulator transcription factor [Paraburkholderia sp. CNPSo 3076]MCX5544918.1 response regulator transcription factor [Paraburkholderia sp. CNPSo 3076]